jgi:hypothetical protein
MSKIVRVLRNKNKLERREKARRSEDLARLKSETAFTARLNDEMKVIDAILRDPEVDKVVIEIPDKQLTLFSRAIYREEMTQYSIIQVGDNTFEVGRRIINF